MSFQKQVAGFDIIGSFVFDSGTREVTVYFTLENQSDDVPRDANIVLKITNPIRTNFEIRTFESVGETRGGQINMSDISDGEHTVEFRVDDNVVESWEISPGVVDGGNGSAGGDTGHDIAIDSIDFANNPTSSMSVVDVVVQASNTVTREVTETFDVVVNNVVEKTLTLSLGASNTGSGTKSKFVDVPVPDASTMTVGIGEATATSEVLDRNGGSDGGTNGGGGSDPGNVPSLEVYDVRSNLVNETGNEDRWNISSNIRNNGGFDAKAWWSVIRLNSDEIERSAIAVSGSDTSLPEHTTSILRRDDPLDDSHFSEYPVTVEIIAGYVETGSDATASQILEHPDSHVTSTKSVTIHEPSKPQPTPEADLVISSIYAPHYQGEPLPANTTVTVFVEALNQGDGTGTKWFNVRLNGSKIGEFRAFEVAPGDTWTSSVDVDTTGQTSLTVSSDGTEETFTVSSDGGGNGSNGSNGGGNGDGSGENGDGGGGDGGGDSATDLVFWLAVAAVLVGIGVVALIIGT